MKIKASIEWNPITKTLTDNRKPSIMKWNPITKEWKTKY
jgi:hypothetical protein